MRAFKHFDTSAYLEDVKTQLQRHTPATVATVATKQPKKARTVARVATVAGVHPESSKTQQRSKPRDRQSAAPSEEAWPIPEIQPPRSEWDPETAALIAWFSTTEPPAQPFELQRSVTVAVPAQYWQYLRQDIAAGSNRARGKTGALLDDLRRLHKLFGGD